MNKIVLITGGSRGIGSDIAKYFASHNYTVAFTYSKEIGPAHSVLQMLKTSSSLNHQMIKVDLTKEEEINSLFLSIRESYGALDLLINNAGTTEFIKHKNLELLETKIFDHLYALNLRAPFLTSRYAKDLMENREDSQIINISSIAATTANGSNIAYCALKAGLVNMTKSLGRALAPKIRVNSISPGLIDTELTRGWDEYRSDQISKTPLGRLGTGEDVAEVAYALATQMKFVTGQDLVVDGGRVLSI